MIVIQINIFLEVCFDDWCVHSSRFKILRGLRTHLKEKRKPKKEKRKPTAQAGEGGKARSNGINEGKCAGMCLCRKFLLCISAMGEAEPA